VKILAEAHREYERSHETASLIDNGGMNYTVSYEDRDFSERFAFVDNVGTNDYEDALHLFAILVNKNRLEIW